MQGIISFLKDNKIKIALVAIVELLIILQGIYCYTTFSASMSVLLITGIAVILVALLAGFLFYKSNLKECFLNKVFLAVFLVAGCFYLAVFPPNSVPDEIYHFQASYKYSDILLGQEVDSSEITIRNEDKPLFEDQEVEVSFERYKGAADNFSFFASEDGVTTAKVMSSFNVSDNPPQTKFASVIGLTLGIIFGLGAYPVYYLGRLFNLLVFAVMVYFSIKITPVAKNVFRVIALLPMTLHLAASYSYDPMIIGMSFLFIACCLKAIYEKGLIEKKLLIALGILMFLIAPCKIIYSCTVFLVLLIPKERFASRKLSIAVKGGLLLIGVVVVVLLRITTLATIFGVSLTSVTSAVTTSSGAVTSGGAPSAGLGTEPLDIRGNETGHFYTISDVLADPVGIIELYIVSFGDIGAWYLESAIGNSLGWFQESIIASDLIPIAFIIILLVASLKSSDEDWEISGKLRVALIGIVMLVWILASASMLLGHTFVSDPHINGVQGRYILPVLPLLLLALHNKKIVYQGNPVRAVLISAFALNLLYMNFVFAKALMI